MTKTLFPLSWMLGAALATRTGGAGVVAAGAATRSWTLGASGVVAGVAAWRGRGGGLPIGAEPNGTDGLAPGTSARAGVLPVAGGTAPLT